METVENVHKRNCWKRILFMTIVFAFMLFLNSQYGYCTDDYHFKFVFQNFEPVGDDVRIMSVLDTFRGTVNYYYLSGGRVLAHELLFCIQMFDKSFFNIINSLLFVVLGYLMWKLVPNKAWQEKKYSLGVTYLFIFLFSYSFGDCVIWISGAVNYLWMAVINLSALYYVEKNWSTKSRVSLFLMSVLCFLSGLTNENSGGMLILLLLFRMIGNRNYKADKFKILFLGSWIICGMAVVLLAPGNINRSEVIDTSLLNFSHMGSCIIGMFFEMLRHSWLIFVLCGVVMLIHLKKQTIQWIISENRYLWTGIVGIMVLALSNTVILRATFLASMYLIVAACNSLSYCFPMENNLKYVR